MSDVGTCEEPNQPAVSESAVLVNGFPVINKGELILDPAPGHPISRPFKKQ